MNLLLIFSQDTKHPLNLYFSSLANNNVHENSPILFWNSLYANENLRKRTSEHIRNNTRTDPATIIGILSSFCAIFFYTPGLYADFGGYCKFP